MIRPADKEKIDWVLEGYKPTQNKKYLVVLTGLEEPSSCIKYLMELGIKSVGYDDDTGTLKFYKHD